MSKEHNHLSPVENPKHAPEKLAWDKAMLKHLQLEHPQYNIRMDEEHFICDIGDKEVHYPKWETIPLKDGGAIPLALAVYRDIKTYEENKANNSR
jgi:hypothetical protein